MKSIIFIAPPAAGKGTQSEIIKEKYNIPHISTGDLLRAASKENNERGKYITLTMKSGDLISDDITLELVKERLEKDDCRNGYILDGFPRNVEQAKNYNKILKELNKQLGVVIVLDLEEEVARKRIVGRLVCGNCGAVFNSEIEGMQPHIADICDECGNKLDHRADDNNETFKHRYETYQEATKPLIDYYNELGVLHYVDSSQNKDEVFTNISKILEM